MLPVCIEVGVLRFHRCGIAQIFGVALGIGLVATGLLIFLVIVAVGQRTLVRILLIGGLEIRLVARPEIMER
jgi:hypothetical protein